MKPIHCLLGVVTLCSPLHSASMRFLAWNDQVAEQGYAFAHGKERTEIGYLHPSARSKPFEVPEGAEDLRLELLGKQNAEGQPMALPLKARSGVDNALVLLLPDPKSPAGLRVMILDDSLSSFKWGSIRFINATPKDFAFRWDKQAKLVPKGWKPTEVRPGGDNRNMEVFLYLKDNLKEPLYSAVWEHREDMRQLVFLVPSKDTSLGPVEFKMVPEVRIEKKEEAP